MTYHRHSIASIDEVLPLIGSPEKVNINGLMVNAKSLRLLNFKKSIICYMCGIEGSFFALEKSIKNPQDNYHLNLYASTGQEEILMTHDHVLARSLGGSNHISNTKTACAPCNWEKGLVEAQIKKGITRKKA